jgi:diaminopropionate ammonia-lyase
LGLRAILAKDESVRMGAGSFKILGVWFAVQQWVSKYHWKPSTLAAASDGNHGRAVARVARELGFRAFIFLPKHVPSWRIRQIQHEGAQVRVVDGTYDEALDEMEQEGRRQGWLIVSDFYLSSSGELTAWIGLGYRALFEEMETQLLEAGLIDLDLLMLQAGVGTFASAGITHFRSGRSRFNPRIVIVEPDRADCLFRSAVSPLGEPARILGKIETAMTGLNCGRPSRLAWPAVRKGANGFLAIGESYAQRAVRVLRKPKRRDTALQTAESGAAGLAGLLALIEEPAFEPIRKDWNLGARSSAVFINTERFDESPPTNSEEWGDGD